MRGNDLLDKMTLIDPAYVEEADATPINRRTVWIKWGAMAACLCLVTMAAFTLPGRWNVPIIPDATTPLNKETVNEIHNDLATEPYSPSTVNGTNGQEMLGGKPMISGYGESTFPVDMSVTNGGVCYSASLGKAMDVYGDTVNYRVLIELFSDGVQISSGSALAITESQRLSDLGYIVACETKVESEIQGELATTTVTYYFTLHVTYEQLANFQANSNLGYSFMLYDEYFDSSLRFDTQVYNAPQSSMPSVSNPIMPFDELFTEPPCYEEEASDGVSN